MKSVKILSEELGVSKQTIFNHIKRLNVETIKQENTSFIKKDNDIEKIIQKVNENRKKYGFENTTKDRKNSESDNNNVGSKSDTEIIKILKNQIDNLNRQLEKQESHHETTIEFYRKELQKRSKLLENQQILSLESNKKIQKLENQLEKERQINYFSDKPTNDRRNVEAQEATYITDSINNNEQQGLQKETEVQQMDITEGQSDEIIHNEGVPFNQNDNDVFIEEKDEENQPKKGFWSRLFGG